MFSEARAVPDLSLKSVKLSFYYSGLVRDGIALAGERETRSGRAPKGRSAQRRPEPDCYPKSHPPATRSSSAPAAAATQCGDQF